MGSFVSDLLVVLHSETADIPAEAFAVGDDQVQAIKPLTVSQMPKGLIENLNAQELCVMLAHLISAGDSENEFVYSKN